MATVDLTSDNEKTADMAQQKAPVKVQTMEQEVLEPGPDEPYVPESSQTDTPASTSSTAPQKRYFTFEELRDIIGHKPQTEETEQERKKRKREELLAKIGDGFSAFHHAYSAAKGTESMVDPRVSLSERVRERYDRLRKERENNLKTYTDAYMRAMQMERYDDKDEYQKLRDIISNNFKEREITLKENKSEREDELAKLKQDLLQGKIDGQTFDNKVKEINAKHQETLVQSKINRNNRPPSRSGGSGRPAEYPWYDSNGNLHYAHSEAAARQNATLHGTWKEGEQTSTSTRRKGRQTTTTTTTKPAKGHSVKPQKGARTKALGL